MVVQTVEQFQLDGNYPKILVPRQTWQNFLFLIFCKIRNIFSEHFHRIPEGRVGQSLQVPSLRLRFCHQQYLIERRVMFLGPLLTFVEQSQIREEMILQLHFILDPLTVSQILPLGPVPLRSVPGTETFHSL